MRLPRGIGGEELARSLERMGYRRIRQLGSHLRLRREGEPDHVITIPMHKNLRVGTLSRVITDVARHLRTDKKELIDHLWGT